MATAALIFPIEKNPLHGLSGFLVNGNVSLDNVNTLCFENPDYGVESMATEQGTQISDELGQEFVLE